LKRQQKSFAFAPGQTDDIKHKMLHWASRCNIFLFLDSNHYRHTSGRYECICAMGAAAQFTTAPPHHDGDWLFGHISYDYKNKLEQLTSAHERHFSWPDLSFFRPETVCYIPAGTDTLCIESMDRDPAGIWEEILNLDPPPAKPSAEPLLFRTRLQQDAYLQQLVAIKEHIRNGDCYELNFCNEAFCTEAIIDPIAAFDRLNQLSPAPFAACYRLQDQYLLCASPERYLYKAGHKLITQPIKGTAARSANPLEDQYNKEQLAASIKERAEHVMIVDLMRNDLARCCIPGSIHVEDLYGIYSFPRVHQMISTVRGQVPGDFQWHDAIRHSFPMGSMTGAPKVMVMQLIEQYEAAARELFSGTVGYISPDGDFDFNVIIRSMFWNAGSRYLSYQTGGAITWDSIPEQEWEETLLKATAMEQVFR
jgi:para-aminobenzoate synthetase component I